MRDALEISRTLQASTREFAREFFATLTAEEQEQLVQHIAACSDSSEHAARTWVWREYGPTIHISHGTGALCGRAYEDRLANREPRVAIGNRHKATCENCLKLLSIVEASV